MRRVSFSDVPDEVREFVDRYPTNFFYNECDVTRFRREIEKCSSGLVRDTSSLTLLLLALIVIGMSMIAIAACLPLLMGITLVHLFRSHYDAVDSSIISIRGTQVDYSHEHATAFLEYERTD